ncbi:uncharacterized protein KY384_002423 [Bacidia gigantensis]|uniref:uncharacterized protein n=1 Tax=Bacidia gigantensis TaxID=2732470 RepID=UPI001D04971C|nr:uncharacterized protein KY384_002423 [Bacidia gigantensis]KAG8532546.1 hypothetical protein KY384_002423 [Bacidia gigantensis]
MASPILLSLAVLFAFYALNLLRQFFKNRATAKASGIPYYYSIAYPGFRLWRISALVLEPLLRLLPDRWLDPWLDLALKFGWSRRFEPFARIGSGCFLIVTPGSLTLYMAEAAAITQVVNRKNDFPKPVEMYGILRIYGDNVVTTETQQWRHHRKITSPPFSERNNQLVWLETLNQTQSMVDSWFDQDQDRSRTITTLVQDAMRLSLHVISRAGFGVGLAWPGARSQDNDASVISPDSNPGHTMTYMEAISTVLHRLLFILLLPDFLLKILPFKVTKEAHVAFVEWRQYMKDIYDKRKSQILAGQEGDSTDLMVSMLKGAGLKAQEDAQDDKKMQQALTEDEILGNAFIFILAGHETTANSIHFTMAYLAMNIPTQRRLQADLDETFGSAPVSEWQYEKHVPQLFNNMAGAVMCEELRLVPPVTDIPKCTRTPQDLVIGGKHYTVPGNIMIHLCAPCAGRNPNSWPAGPPADPDNPSHPYSNRDNDLEEFKPERWILNSSKINETQEQTESSPPSTALPSVDSGVDTGAGLFKPEKGSFLPFSDGHRSCLGRRFAQVELLAFLALVFKHYSVELSVEQWASDEQVEKMDPISKRETWEKAKAKIEKSLRDDLDSMITLQLQKGHLALRLVKRGKETFDYRQ